MARLHYADRLVLADLSRDALEFKVWPGAAQGDEPLPSRPEPYVGDQLTFPLFDMADQKSGGMKTEELTTAKEILIEMGITAALHVTHQINYYTGSRWPNTRPIVYLRFRSYKERLEFQLKWK